MTFLAARMQMFRQRLDEAGIDVALIADDDNVRHLTGHFGYLNMEFGRVTIQVVPRDGESLPITPTINLNSALATARVGRIAAWNDGKGGDWLEELPGTVRNAARIGIEPDHVPPMARSYFDSLVGAEAQTSAAPILAEMRMIESAGETRLARHAGQVSNAMMAAGRAAIGDGVPEHEAAIATSQAGAREAAALLAVHHDDGDMSPNTQFLQFMASGRDIVKTRHHASTRVMQRGEPVFLRSCGMTDFHRFKSGFDRTFRIGEIADKTRAAVHEVAMASQQARAGRAAPRGNSRKRARRLCLSHAGRGLRISVPLRASDGVRLSGKPPTRDRRQDRYPAGHRFRRRRLGPDRELSRPVGRQFNHHRGRLGTGSRSSQGSGQGRPEPMKSRLPQTRCGQGQPAQDA